MTEPRMVELIHHFIDWVDEMSCETADARNTLVNNIGFGKDELKSLGYDYLFDTEE